MGIDYDEALTLARSRTWRTDRRCHERRRQSCPVAVGWPVVDVVVAALRHLHRWQVHSSPRLLLLLRGALQDPVPSTATWSLVWSN